MRLSHCAVDSVHSRRFNGPASLIVYHFLLSSGICIMRYAVVSDIHANLHAWNAVLLDIRRSDVDSIISLGDLIGYGPNPVEVLESAYANIDHFVLGNHDAVVCGKMDASLFNEKARDLICWTQSQVGKEATRFLNKLPLSLDGGSFRCTHGDFSNPAAFNYIIEPQDALASWASVKEQLLFTGHTHQPAIFLLGQSGTPHVVGPQDFAVEEGKRYIVNVGSVGQPRDGDLRATYCVYDTEEQTVHWRRIPFDIFSYRKAMQKAEIDPNTSYFLRHDPTRDLPPLRELLNFSPARTPDESVQKTVEVQELNVLKRSRNRWRNLSILIAAGSILAAGIAGAAWWRHHTRSLDIRGTSAAPLNAVTVQAGKNLLRVPESQTQSRQPIDGWNVSLGNRYRQAVHVSRDGGEGALVLTSRTGRDEIAISSPPIRVSPRMRIQSAALFKKSDDFDGSIAMVLSLTKEIDGSIDTIDEFVIKEPNLKRAEGWMEAKNTEELPAKSSSVRFSIRGRFTGTAEIRNPRIEKRQ